MFAADSELFVPSDEAIHIPTFEELVERFKNFMRDVLDDEAAPAIEFPEAIRSFEKTLITNVELDAIESSLNDFLAAYNEVISDE
jgi:hypothetical protein